MTIEEVLTDLLKQTNPAALAWVAGAATTMKFGMDLARRFRPEIRGNYLQALLAVSSVLVSGAQAATTGIFRDGISGKEALSVFLVAGLTYLAAIGVNETLKDTNRPGIGQERAEDAINAVKAKTEGDA